MQMIKRPVEVYRKNGSDGVDFVGHVQGRLRPGEVVQPTIVAVDDVVRERALDYMAHKRFAQVPFMQPARPRHTARASV